MRVFIGLNLCVDLSGRMCQTQPGLDNRPIWQRSDTRIDRTASTQIYLCDFNASLLTCTCETVASVLTVCLFFASGQNLAICPTLLQT